MSLCFRTATANAGGQWLFGQFGEYLISKVSTATTVTDRVHDTSSELSILVPPVEQVRWEARLRIISDIDRELEAMVRTLGKSARSSGRATFRSHERRGLTPALSCRVCVAALGPCRGHVKHASKAPTPDSRPIWTKVRFGGAASNVWVNVMQSV